MSLLSFQIITVISTVIFLVPWLVIILITPFVLYLSLDWYFWCIVKKVYNNTKNNQDIILLTEIEHEGIERHFHTI